MPLDGRVTISFQRPMRSTWAGAPTPVDLAHPDLVGETYYRYTLEAVRVLGHAGRRVSRTTRPRTCSASGRSDMATPTDRRQRASSCGG